MSSISSEASVVPYWSHRLQDTLLQALPDWLLSRYLNGLHRGLRSRYMRKLADERAAAAAVAAPAPAPAAAATASGGGVRSGSKKSQ